MFRIVLRTLVIGQFASWPLLYAAAADNPDGEPVPDGPAAATAVAESLSDGNAKESAPKRESDIDAPTHRQVRQLVPKVDGEKINVNTFCLSPQGHILAACDGRKGVAEVIGPDGSKAKPRGCIVIFDGDAKQQAVYDLSFRPTAVNLAPDGTLFAAGEGNVAHLTPEGEVILQAAAPNIGDEEEFRKKAIAAAKKQVEQEAELYKQQIEVLQKRVDQLEETPAEKRTRTDEARLAAYKSQLELYENVQNQQADVDLEDRLRQLMTITAIAATEHDVFVSCRSIEGHGYTVWRTDHSFENARPVVTEVRGCCGQMDLQCFADKLIIAENTSFKVGIYDRDGESIGGFGKRDRSSKTGFGSCCNPMNVRPLADGSVLTAESSIGHIKRFDQAGNLLSYIGKAKVAGGCKHCCLGYDARTDQYYMMHEDANLICVLANRDNLPELSPEARKAAAIREEFDARLLGTWELGDRSKKKSSLGRLVSGLFGGGSSSNTSVPFETMTLNADGSLAAKGGQYAQYGEAWTWTPTANKRDTIHLSLSADQVEMLTLDVQLTGENAARIGCSFYGQKMDGVAAVRTIDCHGKPCGEACEEEADSGTPATAAEDEVTPSGEPVAVEAESDE